MKRARWPTPDLAGITLVASLLITAACSAPDSPPVGVYLDGLFDEWTEAATIIDDPPDAPESAVDVLSVQGLDDAEWFYLALDVGNEVSLQSLPGTLHLLFDIDDDRATGGTMHDMDGVDLVLDLSQTAEPLVAGHGSGFAMRLVNSDGTTRAMERYSLGLMAAPTSSAPRFELRVSRLGNRGVAAFGRRLRLGAVYVENDTLLEQTPIGSYDFLTRPADQSPTPSAELPVKSPGAVRVAQWNVASTGFRSRAEGMARVLAAVEPDVLLLDEIAGSTSHDSISAFFALGPLRSLGPWLFVSSGTGGRQMAVVAARRRDIRPAESMRRVPYLEGSLTGLARSLPSEFPALALEAERGLSVAAAWVDVGGSEALFVSLDLQAAGWIDSPSDRLRTLQAETVHTYVARELAGQKAPVVIGGDFNLVGSRRPLFALSRGLDVDGSDLLAAEAERLGERTLATWRSPDNLFLPGRLDYVLFPDAAASSVNSFVLATEDLGDRTLERLGLERGLMRSLSDHLIVVVDLLFPAAEAPVR
jgi:endonuclease/exonuclease/phosphatase family metal-dependent hydrolase